MVDYEKLVDNKVEENSERAAAAADDDDAPADGARWGGRKIMMYTAGLVGYFVVCFVAVDALQQYQHPYASCKQRQICGLATETYEKLDYRMGTYLGYRQTYAEQIGAFYQKNNPDKLEGLPKMLEKYKGREKHLLNKIVKKYEDSELYKRQKLRQDHWDKQTEAKKQAKDRAREKIYAEQKEHEIQMASEEEASAETEDTEEETIDLDADGGDEATEDEAPTEL
jgi:hypothetical protein